MFEKKDGGGSGGVTSEKKTQEIKGNAEGFAEARKRLEQNLNKNNSSFSDLPPPPPSLIGLPDLPPPPPPTESGGFNLPTLPPPPSLDILGLPPLPPPPPMDSQVTQLSPPPVLPPLILPPPPILSPVKTEVKVENSFVAELPLPPPPPQITVEVSKNEPKVETKAEVPPQPFEVNVKQKKEVKVKGNETQSLTTSILGKDIAGFIRSEFLKDVDILQMIGSKVQKKTYNFSFPSIENKTREGETEDVRIV